jgi:hypothetical protein
MCRGSITRGPIQRTSGTNLPYSSLLWMDVNPLSYVGRHVYRSAMPYITALRVSLDLIDGNLVSPQILSI